MPVPSAYIDVQDCRPGPEAWRFEGRSRDETLSVASRAGLEATQLERVRALSLCDADGCSVFADAALVWSLSPATRSALYRELARYPANRAQQYPHFRARSLGPWSAMPGLTPAMRDAIARLTWTTQDHYALSDLAWLCAALSNDADRTLALSTLRVRYGLDVGVRPPASGPIAPLVRYWSFGDDDRLEALFDDARRTGATVPLRALLPPLPRERLDTFPAPDEPDYDCFWTALNFFSSPDDPLGNDGTPGFKRTLRQRYVEIASGDARFGDLIVFWGRDDMPVHAANLIADDVVFTKNGGIKSRPWTLMHLREVQLLYPGTMARTWRRREG